MDKTLLEKYLNNKCSNDEKEKVVRWLNNNNNDDVLNYLLQQLWKKEEKNKLQIQSNDQVILMNIFKRLNLNSDYVSKFYKRKFFSRSKLYYKAAASIALLITSFALYFLFFNNHIDINTTYGEKQEVILPDGSKVILNNNSSLKYARTFLNHDVREVWLEGEAFFNVVHTATNERFIVKTKNLDIEVLGTSFNLIDRNDKVEVVLSSGKVKLGLNKKGQKTLFMKPGELVELKNDQLVKKTVDSELYTSWRHNLLYFEKTTLKEIAQMINNNFGHKVKFDNQQLASLTFTGSNPADNLELLLETLAISFDLTIKQNKNEILISQKSNFSNQK